MAKRTILLVVITILIVWFGLFGPVLMGKKIFFSFDFGTSDLLYLNFPLMVFYKKVLLARSLPFWTSDLYNGFPLLAEGQIAAFYPLNILFYSFLPAPYAFNLLIALSYLLSFIFMYLLARSLNLSIYASALAATAFSFSGFMIGHYRHINILSSALFLPLLFYFLLRFRQSGKANFLLFLSFTLAIQIFAGSLQIVFFSVFALISFVLWHTLNKFDKKFLISFIFSVAFGFLLAGIQLLPTYQLFTLSDRSSGLTKERLFEYPYKPSFLITFLSPFHYGNPSEGTYPDDISRQGIFWENLGYIGVLPLFLSIFALLKLLKKRRIVLFLFLLAIFSLFLALGESGPFKLAYEGFPFNLFRVPSRIILLVCFSLSLLAGFGLDCLERVNKALLLWLLFLLSAFDLFLFSQRYLILAYKNPWLAELEGAKSLAADTKSFRVTTPNAEEAWIKTFVENRNIKKDLALYLPQRELFPVNTNLNYNISSHFGQTGLLLQSTKGFQELLRSPLLGIEQKLKVLSAQNVKYLILTRPVDYPKVKLIKEIEVAKNKKYYLYENLSSLPRVYWVEDAYFVNNQKEALERLISEEADLQDLVLIQKDLEVSKSLKGLEKTQKAELELLDLSRLGLKVKVKATNEGYLVWLDTYYPEWQVFVDGQKDRVLLANGAFKAVYLNSGSHLVEFKYQGIYFKIGAAISLLSLLFLLVFKNKLSLP